MAIFGNTLYYPGCISKIKEKHIAVNYEKILKQLGINFKTIKELELCCGIPALYAGYREEFLDIIDRNREIFENQKITSIITNCPTCFKVFNKEYNIKTEHVTQVISRNLHKLNKDYDNERVSYHDPCSLGRKSGIYGAPRDILRSIGFNVIEMKTNKEDALCCGAGGLLKANSPRIADRIATLRLKQSMAKKLITTCPLCYMHLKQNAKDIEVLELSEVLV